jgi:hypothetical protein
MRDLHSTNRSCRRRFKRQHMNAEILSDDNTSLILPALSDPDYIRSTILPALEAGCRIVAAQAANSYFRSDPFSPPANLRANSADMGRQRLVQSEISTRMLEGVIGALLLCVIVVFATSLRAARLDPKCPCSIAAMASLLAGSRMLGAESTVPEWAEWWSESEARRGGLFQWEPVYGIGWWAGGEGRPLRVGIDRNPRVETDG